MRSLPPPSSTAISSWPAHVSLMILTLPLPMRGPAHTSCPHASYTAVRLPRVFRTASLSWQEEQVNKQLADKERVAAALVRARASRASTTAGPRRSLAATACTVPQARRTVAGAPEPRERARPRLCECARGAGERPPHQRRAQVPLRCAAPPPRPRA